MKNSELLEKMSIVLHKAGQKKEIAKLLNLT